MDWREEEGKNRRLKTQLSIQWKRPAGPRPNHTLLWPVNCDTLSKTNRGSVSLTETLTDRWSSNNTRWSAVETEKQHITLKQLKHSYK